MTIAAGANIEADDIADIDTEVGQKGYVTESVRTTSSGTITTTETVIQSVTFTAVSTVRYKVTAMQSIQASVAGDGITMRIRYEAGASLTTSGTQIRVVFPNADIAGKGQIIPLVATVTGLSGQYTVGVTAVRTTGTGNVSSFGSSGQENTILVEGI